MHKITEFLFWILRYPVQNIRSYQDRCRIYLDEYEGQEELRKDYVINQLAIRLNRSKEYIKEIVSKSKSSLSLLLELLFIDSTDNFEKLHDLDNCWVDFENLINKTDTYFERRWLKRN